MSQIGQKLGTRQPWLLSQLMLQVFFTGMTIGLFRTAIPALSEQRFGLPADSFFTLSALVLVFGLVKPVCNFLAGNLSERYGRKRILLLGWLIALPIPWILAYSKDWLWVVFAAVLLGVNQGFCWSLSQIMKLDICGREKHGLAIGINEFFGYVGVAISGYLIAVSTARMGLSVTMLMFAPTIIVLALMGARWGCRETLLHFVRSDSGLGGWLQEISGLFATVSFHNRCTAALCLAGLVEKFIDVLVWIIYPVFLYRQGVSLTTIGVITGLYGISWGVLQLPVGSLSDKIGRKPLIVSGMLLAAYGCTASLLHPSVLWWSVHAVLVGCGMAMLYPTLSAAISDRSPPKHRPSYLGIYRFWRDFGYLVGALVLAAASALSGSLAMAFVITTVSLVAATVLLLVYWRSETEEETAVR